MSPTWRSADLPDLPPVRPMGHVRAGLRAIAVGLLLGFGTVLMLVLRLIELVLFAPRRPLSAVLVQGVWRTSLRLIGLSHQVDGAQPPHNRSVWQAIVANHASWLDIVTLGAAQPVVFVSKADVARWPVIGTLSRMIGTVFITRDPRDAKAQQAQLTTALTEGHTLVLFPEGTSTDGLRVLPFKSTLLSAFYPGGAPRPALIQPVSVIYSAPEGVDEARFYGWWGDMEFAPHLWRVLAQSPQGRVTIRRHEPVEVEAFADRKALSRALEEAVRNGMPPDRQSAA